MQRKCMALMLENLIGEKLKSPETSSAYREKLNEYLAKHADNDDIEAWMILKNAIMQTADIILNRMERVTYKDWFDAECEQATINKNKAYKRMQQRKHTRKAVEEYRTARKKKKKRVHKQKEKIFIEHELEELERLRSNNESKFFYRKLNKSRKDFQPRTILC
jgi:hypothetical protein